jgi:hypothetical protein
MNVYQWHAATLGKRAVESLNRNKFDSDYFETRDELMPAILKYIKPGISVGFGGSQTTTLLGIRETIIKNGGIILDHNAPGLSPKEKLEIMRKQQVCDIFICSVNAITLDGFICNIDGNGNRIAAMVFGPRKVIVIAGTNKICKDEKEAWERIRKISAPLNMKRLGRPNPCTESGECMDCNLPTRGCNIYVTLRRKPSLTDFSVFIIGENLGY